MNKLRLFKRLKTIFIISAVLMLFPLLTNAAGTDEAQRSLLNTLNIMTGDPDGSFRPDDYVTRAEFAKVAVASSDYRNSVASGLSVSPFYDVPYTHWAAPYVRVGVTAGYVSGYPDASFRPDENVSFEEAVAIMLRVLGYSDSDFGAAWPQGQIGMAQSLGMTDGMINAQAGYALTRSDVATLVYNTLKTDIKDTANALISVFDAQFTEDVTLISTSREDGSIASDEVFTDSGTFKITDSFNYDYVGMKGDLAVKNGKTVIGFVPNSDESPDESYVIYSVLSDNIIVYRNGSMTSLDIPDGTTAYNGTQATTYGALKQSFEMGDLLSVKNSASGVDYVVYKKGSMKGPYTVTNSGTWADALGITSATSIMRNGSSCSQSDIMEYDILYYIPELDMAFAYTTKVTGVYENATPNKDNPTQIVVSGETYSVEGSNAFRSLSSQGSIAFGDTVTLLLGKNNDVADVISASAENPVASEVVGYLCETGTKTYTSSDLNEYSNYYITIIAANGQSYTYTCSQNYDNFLNSVVSVTINDGTARVSRINSGGASGIFNWTSKRLGSDELSDDIEILDIGNTDPNGPSLYAKVYPSRIDGISISAGNILYCHRDAGGRIDSLILNDVTGDSYVFGVVVSANTSSMGTMASGSYTYIVDGTTYSYASTSSMFTVSNGQGVRLSSAANPRIMTSLTQLRGNISITSITSLTSGGTNYEISPNVQVYERDYAGSATYRLKPISEIIGSDDYSLSAFYDKSPSAGGRIRIIIATKK